MGVLTYPMFIVGLIAAWFIGAAIANDLACGIIAGHHPALRFIERLIFLCGIV